MPTDSRPLISQRSPVTAVLRWILVIGVLILFFWLLGQVLLLIFASVLVAILLSAPASWVSHQFRIRYGWSLAIIVVALCLALVGIGFTLAPKVSLQIDQISAQLPEAIRGVIGSIEKNSIGRLLIGHFAGSGSGSASSLIEPIVRSVSSLTVALGSIAFIMFMGLYLAAAPRHYERGVLWLVPSERCARTREIIEAVGLTLKYFLFGRLFSMSIIAICSMLGLWTLGVPAPIALGLLAGGLSFVPYVGSAASGVIPFLLAYVRDPTSGLYVILLYLGIHLLDGYVLVPLVQRRMVHLMPAVTLAAQLTMGMLWGILGISVATPVAAALMTFLDLAYIQDVLHKKTPVARNG